MMFYICYFLFCQQAVDKRIVNFSETENKFVFIPQWAEL